MSLSAFFGNYTKNRIIVVFLANLFLRSCITAAHVRDMFSFFMHNFIMAYISTPSLRDIL